MLQKSAEFFHFIICQWVFIRFWCCCTWIFAKYLKFVNYNFQDHSLSVYHKLKKKSAVYPWYFSVNFFGQKINTFEAFFEISGGKKINICIFRAQKCQQMQFGAKMKLVKLPNFKILKLTNFNYFLSPSKIFWSKTFSELLKTLGNSKFQKDYWETAEPQ